MKLSLYHERARLQKAGVAPDIVTRLSEQDKVISILQSELRAVQEQYRNMQDRLRTLTSSNITLKKQLKHQGILNEYSHNKEANNRSASNTHK